MSSYNTDSVEEGIIDTTNVDVQQVPAPAASSSKRKSKIIISVAVMAMSIVAVVVALSTGKNGKKQAAKNVSPSLIIGGTEAIKDSYPYIVSIAGCGGSLIARDVVLTAAHCDTDTYEVVLGRHASFDTDGEVISIKSRLPHPDYDDSTFNADFMLVFLDHEYTIGNVDLVSLNSDPSFPFEGQEVTAMGWGTTSFGGTASDVLLNVDLNIISDEQCALTEAIDSSGTSHNYQDEVTDWENALCALGVDGKDTCQGDSGGPLVVRGDNGWADIQVGVVSWGIECGIVGVPGIYSQVSTAYSWIQEEVCKGSVYASEAGFDCSSVAVASNVFPTYAPTYLASTSNPDSSIPTYSSS